MLTSASKANTSLDKAAFGRRDLLQYAPTKPEPFKGARCVTARSSVSQPEGSESIDRRALLFGTAAAAVALPQVANAEGDTKVLYGLASPPTSYGGYGGNAKEAAKYTYEYPSNWKQEVVGKQEKGMVGIDSRVRNPRVKLETAFTVTFGRAGEDNKRFKLGDAEQTLQGFAGADYDLQDCLTGATYKKSGKREKDGQEFYDYELASNEVTFLVTVSLKAGKVFALFVKAPAKVFKADEAQLRNIVDTFTIL